MIANQIIQTCLDELKSITKIDMAVTDLDGTFVAETYRETVISPISIRSFIDSQADNEMIQGKRLYRILDEDATVFVLIVDSSMDESYAVGRIAVSQLQQLVLAYKEKFDNNNFFQNLIMDNLLLVDIYNKAKKLHIPIDKKRAVFLIEIGKENDSSAMSVLKGLFTVQNGDYLTAVDERNLIVIKSLESSDNYESLDDIAKMIVDMMNSEAMIKVRVTYGTIVNELKDVSKSYKEAQMSLDVGKIFYGENDIVGYNTLGIGRLIYQLPTSLCEIFLKEIFGDDIPDDLDDETLTTINKFFENNLNVSESSRQLYIHRNTLVYRIEKLQKRTGLDIRVFEDALTLRIALMVQSYLHYLKENNKY